MFVKQRRKHTSKVIPTLFQSVFVALLFVPVPVIADDPPFLFTGTSAGLSVASGVDGETTYDVFAGGELTVGRRGTFGGEGSYSFASKFQGMVHKDLVFSDQEYVKLQLSFATSTFEAAVLSSLIDDGSGSTYFNPSFNTSTVIASFSNDRVLSLEYAGYLVFLPSGTEDNLYQGLLAVYRSDPSIRSGYELVAGGSWEYYYEQPVYLQSGEPAGAYRQDLVLDIIGAVDGLAGYFTEWAVSGGVSWRTSSATLTTGTDFFDRSEDRLQATIDASLFTSPHRSWTIVGELSAAGIRYLWRPARRADGLYTDERLSLLDIGASGRAEWSPDQKTYISLDTAFGYTLSNDSLIGGWYARSVLQLTL